MNPYAPPMSPYAAPPAMAPPAPSSVVSEQSIEMLRQTRPWVILIGVLCFLGCGLMVLEGLGAVAMGAMASAAAKSAIPMLIGLVYVPMGLLYIYPGIKLIKYAGAIGRLLQTRASADMDAALEQQKSFWKFSGIAAIVVIVLTIVGAIVAAVVVSVSAATMLK
jgi:hypothetical protein